MGAPLAIVGKRQEFAGSSISELARVIIAGRTEFWMSAPCVSETAEHPHTQWNRASSEGLVPLCRAYRSSLRSLRSIVKVVGAIGFEPTTSWSQTRRSTKLSYTPMFLGLFDLLAPDFRQRTYSSPPSTRSHG